LGLRGQPTQKNFEAGIWQKLQHVKEGPLFIEAEGRKIGNLTLPDFIMRRIDGGKRILVTASNKARVHRLIAAYMPEADHDLVAQAREVLPLLTSKLGKQMIFELNEHADHAEFADLVEKLLVNYYDPLYDVHILKHQPYALEVCSDSLETAAATIVEWNKRRCLV
jgi:tRNA 2-selenouridine synthase